MDRDIPEDFTRLPSHSLHPLPCTASPRGLGDSFVGARFSASTPRTAVLRSPNRPLPVISTHRRNLSSNLTMRRANLGVATPYFPVMPNTVIYRFMRPRLHSSLISLAREKAHALFSGFNPPCLLAAGLPASTNCISYGNGRGALPRRCIARLSCAAHHGR